MDHSSDKLPCFCTLSPASGSSNSDEQPCFSYTVFVDMCVYTSNLVCAYIIVIRDVPKVKDEKGQLPLIKDSSFLS